MYCLRPCASRPVAWMWALAMGAIHTSRPGEGNETLLAVIAANDVLGEMGVMDGAPRSASAIAHTMCVTYWLPTEQFLDVLVHNAALAVRLLVVLAQRLRATNQRVA